MLVLKILITVSVVVISVKLFNWYKRRKRLVEAIEKLPGPPNISYLPIINHAIASLYLDSLNLEIGSSALVYHSMLNIYRLFPDTGIIRLWVGPKPVVILYSPETVEPLLSSTSNVNKADLYSVFEPWIGEGLVTSKRAKWRFRRKILTPAFHFRILIDFLPIINREATKLIKVFNQPKYVKKDTVFDVMPSIAHCTLDTICETAMGTNINCQDDEDSDYVKCLREVAEMSLIRVTRPWLWSDFVFFRTEFGKRFTHANQSMHDFSNKVILERKEAWQKEFDLGEDSTATKEQASEFKSIDDIRSSAFFKRGNNRLAFLDLLLHQHMIENTMNLDDVREEVDTFMFAVSSSRSGNLASIESIRC